jgi:hypothetical protein
MMAAEAVRLRAMAEAVDYNRPPDIEGYERMYVGDLPIPQKPKAGPPRPYA